MKKDNMKIEKLKNNLRFIVAPMAGTKTATILVLFGTGSKYETRKNNGISHFLEHMFFKGTEKRPTAMDISSVLDSVGAEFNAFTSKEYTGYWVKVDASKIEIAMDVVSDMLLNSKFNQEEIDREKGVIIEEINMYEDNPVMRINDVFEQCLYGDTPAGWDTLGIKENILSFKRKDFVSYLSSQYGTDRAVVCLAGNIDKKAPLDKYFSSFKKSDFQDKEPVVENQQEPASLVSFKKTDQAHISLGVRTFPMGHKDEFISKVLPVILGGSISSRLFNELREKRGLAYYIYTSSEFFTDSGHLSTQAGVPVDKAGEAIEVILKEYGRLKEELIPEEELKRVKDYIKGKSYIGLESSDNIASWYARHTLMRGKIISPEEYLAKIDEVTAEDIKRVANDIFQNKGLNLAVIGPYEEKNKFNKILKF